MLSHMDRHDTRRCHADHCESPVIDTLPDGQPTCRTHAIAFWQGVQAIARDIRREQQRSGIPPRYYLSPIERARRVRGAGLPPAPRTGTSHLRRPWADRTHDGIARTDRTHAQAAPAKPLDTHEPAA